MWTSKVLQGPPTEIRRCRDEGGTYQEHHTRSQSPQTGGGRNGRPHSEASRHTQPRRGRQPKGGPPAQDLSQVVRALARLALQQETSIKVLRQDTTWIIFLQPGPMSSLSLLFQVGQQWKQNQQRGAVDRPLRSVLIMCLLEHLHKLLGNMQEPLLNNRRTTGSRMGSGNTRPGAPHWEP